MHYSLIYYLLVIDLLDFLFFFFFAIINNIVENIFAHLSWSKHLIIYLKMYQLFKKSSTELQLADLMVDERLGPPRAWGVTQASLIVSVDIVSSCWATGFRKSFCYHHWAWLSSWGSILHWGWGETVGRNEIEGLTPACKGFISFLGTDTCGILKEQIKSKCQCM